MAYGAWDGLAEGLDRGFRMGDAAARSRYQREDREREKKEREREDRINAIVGQSFAEPEVQSMPQPSGPGLGAQPGLSGAQPAQAPSTAQAPGLELQQRSPDLVGQLNGTLNRLFKAASDPANADIAPHLFDKANVIAGSAKRFGDVMLQQARQKAMPHIKVLYSPGASDEQKSVALGALMNEVFPDGSDYQPRIVGKDVQLFDAAGKPVIGADGKPRTLSMDDVDQMLTYGLSTPDDYISAVQESIKDRREQAAAQAKLNEQRAYDERRDDAKYRRDRRDELVDRSYTESRELSKEERAAARALEKEGRDEKRAIVKAKRDFIAKAMAAYDKDAASGLTDPKGRESYLKQIRATAEEQFGGGAPQPAAPTGPVPGDAIDVDLGAGLATPAPRQAPKAAPPVPMPGAAPPAQTAAPRGATVVQPAPGQGYGEMVSGLTDAIEGLEGWKDRQRTSGFRAMADKFRQGLSAGKVDPAIAQRLRAVSDAVLARDYGLSPEEIAVIKGG